jgi:hypothetical protein
LEEDGLSTPNSPVVMPYFFSINYCETSAVGIDLRHSLIDQMNKVHGHYCDSNSSSTCDLGSSYSESKATSVATIPSHNKLCALTERPVLACLLKIHLDKQKQKMCGLQ